jgi:hypothetical protein
MLPVPTNFRGLWKELNIKEVKRMGGFEFVYCSGSITFLAATWCYVRIRCGSRPNGSPP